MAEINRILEQMKLAFEGEAWCGLSLMAALEEVTAERAAKRPLPAAHTIWEIVLHVAAWKGAVCQRLEGEAVKTPDEGDYPPISDSSEKAWKKSLEMLHKNHHRLIDKVRTLTDEELDGTTTSSGGQVTKYKTIHGMIQHDLYHAAQIALLKK